ncbi:multimeric flavodoxin WrbA [Streptomyces sp. DSM 42143]|nr:multimeric flavodoxin WrbA [Streptomyces sp. DSM 42143]
MHALARAVVEGARKAGAHVRLRKVAETAPAEVIDAHPAWARHHRDTAEVAEAGHGDLEWADAVLFGTPTRFGNPAAQLRQFIDTTGPLWFAGKLADKVYSSFTASNSAHGGQEPTLLALGNTFYHCAARLHRPGPVHVGQSLRHLGGGRRRGARRGEPGGRSPPGSPGGRGHRRAQGRSAV